jgi:hypothetical protein
LTALEDDSAELLKALKAELPVLRDLLAGLSGRGYEDPVYRFYHHSYKVFDLQNRTDEIVSTLQKLLPQRELNPLFLEIVAQGTGKEFSFDQNTDWPPHTRPILEAFFHSRFFLEMAVRHAELDKPPKVLPSGWAALLSLYRLR